MKMAFFRSLALSSALFFTVVGFTLAEYYVHDEIGVQFWIPDSWNFEVDEESTVAKAPDSSLTLILLTSELQVVDHVTPRLFDEISEVVFKPEVRKEAGTEEINGLLHLRAEGTGLYEGEIVDWELAFIAGGRKSMLAIALGDILDQREMINTVFRSFTIAESEIEEE
ncbi:MAG TPA: hypothetical protein VMY18_10450 [Acidobacteriota bacterium]|nr:hypothetical protein [Acidobacteriota bacterium]